MYLFHSSFEVQQSFEFVTPEHESFSIQIGGKPFAIEANKIIEKVRSVALVYSSAQLSHMILF